VEHKKLLSNQHGRNFVVKGGGDSLVWNQWSHRVRCRSKVL